MDKLLDTLENYWNNFIELVPRIALGILVVVAGILIAGWVSRIFRSKVLRRANDPLMGQFIANTLKALLIVGVILIGLHTAGLSSIAGAILGLTGGAALIVGFAFRDIGENFLAGIILAFNRPFNRGDTIEVQNVLGKIKNLQFRYTHIKTFDGKDVYIPNATMLNEPVSNYTADGFFRWSIVVGIAYEDNIQETVDLIYNILADHPDVVHDDEHENFVTVENLNVSTVDLKVYFWVETKDFRRGALISKGVVSKDIKERLEEAGVYFPADIQEVKLYGAEESIPLSVQMLQSNQERA